ncbi:RtcB family protein [candidate division FCPU426 bacterium]|nr:RtcB family protein [candidate division FCPU426 bacterium]
MSENESASGWLEPLTPYKWRIPKEKHPGMRVDGVVYASAEMVKDICRDQALQQVVNVAQLPGIIGAALAMPDIHWGYGFPIGGVAAFDAETGIVSPGGVGYDINCGVRLVLSHLEDKDVRPRISELLHLLYRNVPAGVGSEGRIRLKNPELKKVLENGSAWALQQGYGWPGDLERTEDQGRMRGADSGAISSRALERGANQLGTLGSGNHFLEVQVVEEVYDAHIAAVFGLVVGQVAVMIHCGSRGLGYQVCDDFLLILRKAAQTYGIDIPDRQLACAPVQSTEGKEYLRAMAGAANYAWANRQCITHWVRESFEQVFRQPAERLGMHLLYDVAHNIAKGEHITWQGKPKEVCVHRKGATRAFPAGHPEVTAQYRPVGQPVLIPGSMGTASYVCAGGEQALTESFGSTAHGAGRVLSRQAAMRQARGRSIAEELSAQGIQVLARGRGTLAEESPEAYKSVDAVVEAVHQTGLSKKVARLRPLGVIKG